MAELSAEEREFIQRMPKAELHVHLEGSVYPDALLRLADKHGRRLPFSSVEEARDWFKFRDFPHFIEIYVQICDCLLDEEDFEFVTVEMAKRADAQNLRYMEVTFAPVSLLNPRTTALPDVVVAGLRSGAKIATRDHNVDMQFIFDPVRGRTPEEVLASAEWWSGNAGDRLVGFGLGGLEFGNPASRFAEAFDLVRAAGARISLHAGETDGPASIRDALATGTERVGHGVRAIEDPRLVEELAASGILLEVSPTSNICLGVFRDYDEHPFRTLADAGVKLTVNSDDPPMFNTTLTREFEVLVEHFDYTLDELIELSRNAIHGSFLDARRQQALEAQFRTETTLLAAELGLEIARP